MLVLLLWCSSPGWLVAVSPSSAARQPPDGCCSAWPCSPAPMELRHPKLHRPAHSDEINLDATFDVDTPENQPCKSLVSPAKRQKLDKKP